MDNKDDIINRRPKLTDPKEWEIIRKMYFEPAIRRGDDIDPLERLDRMDRKNTKNQAR